MANNFEIGEERFENMNILMVGPDSNEKGGIATVISNFKNYFNEPDIRLFFLSSWTKRKKWRTEWLAYIQIRKLIHEKQIDLVHFHVAQKGSFFRKAFLARLVPKYCRVIFHMHASKFDIFYKESSSIIKWWIRHTFDQLDGVVALSENWAAFYGNLTQTPISVIQNAVKVPEKSLFNPEASNIITLGRVGKRKGSFDLLEIAKEIHPFFPEIQFILYGDGATEKLAKEIQEKNIKNVSLGGWITLEEQSSVLENAILHFLPSYFEGLPMSILETMGAGIPNLTTKVGGIPEAIQSGENGLLVAPGDLNGMFEKLLFFLSTPAFQKSLSQEARNTIQKDFSIKTYHEKWGLLYKNLK